MPENSPAKARALRLPLDSYSRDRLAWIRNVLAIVAASLGVGWLVAGNSNPESSYSPAPLSKAHATFECKDCHSGKAPVSDDTFSFFGLTDATESNLLWHDKTDMLCRECHPVTGSAEASQIAEGKKKISKISKPIPVSPHSNFQIAGNVGRCADCHMEHKGLEHSLLKVADQACVDCHGNIAEFRIGEGDGIEKAIVSFEANKHPDFRSLKSDRGTLKFDHAFHMSPGLRGEHQRESLSKTLADYPNHGGQLDEFVNEGLIELNCSFCHQPVGASALDLRSFISKSNEALSIGRYMSMPNYEQNCRVCHSIDLVPNQTRVDENGAITRNKDGKRVFESDFDVEALKIVHGADSKTISNALKVYFNLEFFAPPKIKSDYMGAVLDMPIQVPTTLWNVDPPEPGSLEKMQKESSLEQMQKDFECATNEVRKTCLHCHIKSEDDPGSGILEVKLMTADNGRFSGGGVFDRIWFKHAKFDHSAHRDVKCFECHHEKTHGKGELVRNGSDLASDKPMIKGLENCLQCHTDEDVKGPRRRAGTNCTKCHTYHGGGNR